MVEIGRRARISVDGDTVSGRFIAEYPKYYLFRHKGGYTEAFLKVDIESRRVEVGYID